MSKQLLLILPLTILFLYAGQAQKVAKTTISPEIEQQIDAIFADYTEPNSPGVAVGVLQNGQLIFQKGYGNANLEYDIPVDPAKTVFPLCSTSKQFTVFAIMLLAEAGKLSLDDDIQKHLPELRDYGTSITIRQLANHTGGIRSDLHLLGMTGIHPDDFISRTMSQHLIYRQKALNFKPGEEFSYSNAGYALLADIVENVSGQDFVDYMQEAIFQPLGMNHSFVMEDVEEVIKNRAYGYAFYNGHYVKDLMNFSLVGSSGVFTTIEDLAKWTLNFSNPKVGNAAIFKEMRTVGILNNGYQTNAALGQFIGNHYGLKEIQHGGASASFRSHLGRFPEQDFAIMLLSNYSYINPRSKAMEVADIFLKPYFKKPVSKDTSKFVTIPSEKLATLTGNYFNTKYFYTRNIRFRNDSLLFIRPEAPQNPSILNPINTNTFQLDTLVNTQISFKSNGSISTMHLTENGFETDVWERYTEKEYPAKTLEKYEGIYYSEELQTSYKIELREGMLTIIHPKMYPFGLRPIKKYGFMSNSWQFTYLEFEEDENQKIKGFRISTGRTRNVLFEKEEIRR